MDGDGEGVKRKFAVEKNLFIFCNVDCGPKCAILYKLNINITTCRSGGDDKKIMVQPSKNNDLMLVELFYDQRSIPRITSVAACVLGSTLYVMPHDEEKTYGSCNRCLIVGYSEENRKLVFAKRETLPPYTLDLLHDKPKKREMPVFPFGRKTFPLMIAAGKNIFALSNMVRRLQTPHPCFELLDPISFNWTQLEIPSFHNDQYIIRGLVVLEKDGFILVSLVDIEDDVFYYSYNISSGVWCPVHLTETALSFNLNPYYTLNHCIYKEAVVVGSDIYTYYPEFKSLLVFGYKIVPGVDKPCDTISLGPQAKVEGLEFNEAHDLFEGYNNERTGTVAIVDDGILCLLHTLLSYKLDYQYFCVTFLQLLPDRKCNTLNSFPCVFSTESVNRAPIAINSCFVMNDLEEKRDHRRAKRANDADANAMIGMESSGTGKVEAM